MQSSRVGATRLSKLRARVDLGAAILGLVLAIVTMAAAMVLPREISRAGLAVILAIIAGLYVGWATATHNTTHLIIETAVVSGFFVLCVLGLLVNPLFIALGYFAHGLWDTVHHPDATFNNAPRWYAPFCLVYDWLVAGFIIWWL